MLFILANDCIHNVFMNLRIKLRFGFLQGSSLSGQAQVNAYGNPNITITFRIASKY